MCEAGADDADSIGRSDFRSTASLDTLDFFFPPTLPSTPLYYAAPSPSRTHTPSTTQCDPGPTPRPRSTRAY